jgi:hypothetical protein
VRVGGAHRLADSLTAGDVGLDREQGRVQRDLGNVQTLCVLLEGGKPVIAARSRQLTVRYRRRQRGFSVRRERAEPLAPGADETFVTEGRSGKRSAFR